ncbi:unnamed protein product [Ilex paraguariensis]|uniref:Cellulose synthase-like protein G3 n=1 Tax=Ilex paraguariensis TaxID=185542 RepID=A0ABC8RDU6_9AQUA
MLHCQVFCNPTRPAFLGDAPITLNDLLNQSRRWSMGLLDVGFCKHSPMNTFHAHTILSGPFGVFPSSYMPSCPKLALLNSFHIFPKVLDTWFYMYAFLFLGAYGKDFLDFMLAGGTAQRWWNNQRMWMVGDFQVFHLECLLKYLGSSTFVFNVTSKEVENEQNKQYEQRIFEFRVTSPLFLPITTAAIINLISFFRGIVQVWRFGSFEKQFRQMFLAGFVVLNSWPVYEGLVLITDKGKMPMKVKIDINDSC